MIKHKLLFFLYVAFFSKKSECSEISIGNSKVSKEYIQQKKINYTKLEEKIINLINFALKEKIKLGEYFRGFYTKPIRFNQYNNKKNNEQYNEQKITSTICDSICDLQKYLDFNTKCNLLLMRSNNKDEEIGSFFISDISDLQDQEKLLLGFLQDQKKKTKIYYETLLHLPFIDYLEDDDKLYRLWFFYDHNQGKISYFRTNCMANIGTEDLSAIFIALKDMHLISLTKKNKDMFSDTKSLESGKFSTTSSPFLLKIQTTARSKYISNLFTQKVEEFTITNIQTELKMLADTKIEIENQLNDILKINGEINLVISKLITEDPKFFKKNPAFFASVQQYNDSIQDILNSYGDFAELKKIVNLLKKEYLKPFEYFLDSKETHNSMSNSSNESFKSQISQNSKGTINNSSNKLSEYLSENVKQTTNLEKSEYDYKSVESEIISDEEFYAKTDELQKKKQGYQAERDKINGINDKNENFSDIEKYETQSNTGNNNGNNKEDITFISERQDKNMEDEGDNNITTEEFILEQINPVIYEETLTLINPENNTTEKTLIFYEPVAFKENTPEEMDKIREELKSSVSSISSIEELAEELINDCNNYENTNGKTETIWVLPEDLNGISMENLENILNGKPPTTLMIEDHELEKNTSEENKTSKVTLIERRKNDFKIQYAFTYFDIEKKNGTMFKIKPVVSRYLYEKDENNRLVLKNIVISKNYSIEMDQNTVLINSQESIKAIENKITGSGSQSELHYNDVNVVDTLLNMNIDFCAFKKKKSKKPANHHNLKKEVIIEQTPQESYNLNTEVEVEKAYDSTLEVSETIVSEYIIHSPMIESENIIIVKEEKLGMDPKSLPPEFYTNYLNNHEFLDKKEITLEKITCVTNILEGLIFAKIRDGFSAIKAVQTQVTTDQFANKIEKKPNTILVEKNLLKNIDSDSYDESSGSSDSDSSDSFNRDFFNETTQNQKEVEDRNQPMIITEKKSPIGKASTTSKSLIDRRTESKNFLENETQNQKEVEDRNQPIITEERFRPKKKIYATTNPVPLIVKDSLGKRQESPKTVYITHTNNSNFFQSPTIKKPEDNYFNNDNNDRQEESNNIPVIPSEAPKGKPNTNNNNNNNNKEIVAGIAITGAVLQRILLPSKDSQDDTVDEEE